MSRIRCERCARPASHCLCALIPSLPSRTRVLVLQHPSEVGHALNTAGLAVLGLRNAELRVGERFAEETWRVPDALSPYYMLIQEDTPEAQVFGCWRILDTTGPYMLKNTFPELLHGKEAPCSPHIWELSRFAINSGQKGSLGFSDCTLEAMRALARYSLQNDIQTLVTVTTVGVEKMMIRAGLDVSRFGPHLKIGIERAVALRIELNAKTQIALYGGVLVEQRLAVS
ncbi:DTW domain-containing protein [Pseudomonas aeruginosa]|uniref:DTW domain-containing protein n=3 Tax=Pseudomonas aeruginosa TaxID=287 RepID=UPI002496ACB6|nr:DTW domain-containing protein [Pseudomonas aeruginosa]MDI2461080.1 DTW domain-containing protein [Pseudomonas aeruginosa]